MNLMRAIRKVVLDPIKYGTIGEKYWADRFKKHGASLKGPGHDGKSEAENQEEYAFAIKQFEIALESAGVQITSKSVLEVGLGLGNYARTINAKSPSSYTGIDITDVNFPQIQKSIPDGTLVKADITKQSPGSEFDVVFCIDVLQHVSKSGFPSGVQHLWSSVIPGGVLVCGPVDFYARKSRWHVTEYNLDSLAVCMDFQLFPFRGLWLAIRRKPLN